MKARDVLQKGEAQTDSLLTKLVGSGYTLLVLVAVVIVVVAVMVLA